MCVLFFLCVGLLKGVKKVRSAQNLLSLLVDFNASKLKNDITRLKFGCI